MGITKEDARAIEKRVANDPEFSYLTQWFEPGYIPSLQEVFGSISDRAWIFSHEFINDLCGVDKKYGPFPDNIVLVKTGEQYAIDVVQNLRGKLSQHMITEGVDAGDLLHQFTTEPQPSAKLDYVPSKGDYESDVRKHLRGAGTIRHYLAMSIKRVDPETALFLVENWRTTRNEQFFSDSQWDHMVRSDTSEIDFNGFRLMQDILIFLIKATSDIGVSSDEFSRLMSVENQEIRSMAMRIAPKKGVENG